VYNNQGLPDTLIGANNYVNATTYNAASQLDALTFGNGALTDYVYNSNNLRLTDIVTTKSGNTLLNLHYGFDNVGNILSVQDTARGETTNYTYDDLDRLLSASVANGGNQYARSWTYDALGNMQTRVEQGVTTNYSYDPNHKHAVASAGGATYQYDANGNMTNRNGDALTYDVENRLTSVTKAGVTTSFAYNGDGTRVKRNVSNAGTTYYIGNYFEVWVPNSGTTTFNKYYYFGSQRVAARIASTLFYFQGDHLGSSSVAMTQAGTSFYSRQTYYPYGAPRTAEGSALPTDYTFTGQKNDDSTGLMFYGARYYDATLGRFTQADTIIQNLLDPQALNRYGYARNNPVRYSDPTGHMFCEEGANCDGGGGSGGGGTGGGGSGDNNGNTPSETNAQPPADTPSNQTANEGACQGPRRKCDSDYDPEIDENPVTGQDSPTAFYAEDPYNVYGQQQVKLFQWLDAHPSYQPLADPLWDRDPVLAADVLRWQLQQAVNSNKGLSFQEAAALAGPFLIAATGGGGTLTPGPYAVKSIPARGPGTDFNAHERAALDKIGYEYGCHTCGTKNPGTKSGHFVPDHQPPSRLNVSGGPQELYPQCLACSRIQGGEVNAAIWKELY
jgi:RHS repeat-associated protein